MIKKFLFLLLFSVSIIQSQTSLKLNEIMFYPPSGNNEFIELYNSDPAAGIDLNGFKIKYYTASADIITDAGMGTVLKPQSYAVIFEGDYDFASGIYNDLIPPGTLIIKIADNSFGATGMSNTSNRPLWLISAEDDTIDVYTYTADNSQTHSDEKIHWESDSSQTNWDNSILSSGTPGYRNSVTPLQFNLSVSLINILPGIPIEGNNVSISSVIKNSGENTAGNFSISIFNDTNLDSIPQSGEQIFIQNYNSLIPGDSVSVSAVILAAPSGVYNIIVNISYAPDEDTSDNTVYKSFIVYPPGAGYNDIVINEIMYAPFNDEPEWIEIYNRSQDIINLRGWMLSDNSTTKVITRNDIYVAPGSYAVITEDSSILGYYSIPSAVIEFNLPALNNTGDQVVIKDSMGIIIDSLYYVPSWGGSEGRSLERISAELPGILQSTWSTSESIFRATPGKINSVTPKDNDLKISSFKSTAEYVIIDQPAQLDIVIKNIGLNHSPAFSLSLYYDTDRDSVAELSELIKTLNSNPLTQGDSIQLNAFIENCNEGINGIIARLEVSPDDDTTNNTAFTFFTGVNVNVNRNDLIINEFMYEPASPSPEWIEIYNRSGKPVNLSNYRIADSRDTITFNTGDSIIHPDTYAVIAEDSTIKVYFDIPSALFIKSFPALNNSGDKIMLLDSLNRIIDSLEYTGDWNGIQGKSLERISSDNPSAVKENWTASLSLFNGTPGYMNSVTPKAYDIAVEDIIPSPLYPVFGDDVSLAVKVSNTGLNNAVFTLNLYEDTDNDSLPDVLLATVQNLSVAAEDSLLIETGYIFQNILNPHIFYAETIFDEDMDTSNNHIIKNISPGYHTKSVVINEIMYSPPAEDSEWIEILNVSPESINLKDWSVSDLLNNQTQNIITDSDFYIYPGGFAVIAKDSSFLFLHPDLPNVFITSFGTLGNTEDGAILYDERNIVIDSVLYHSDWGGDKGFSLERISASGSSCESSNWTTSLSADKSTPGKENSIIHIQEGIRNSVVINEIMFDPGIDNCEFIELYNMGPDSVNLGGWHIEDQKGNSYKVSRINCLIAPASYFLLAADSLILQKYDLEGYNNISFSGTSGLGLLNDEELIWLKDFRGNTIDSVFYSSGWHNRNMNITKNKSLEKINPGLEGNNPFNWSTSVCDEGATPGKQNSIFTDNNKRQTNISVSPNPFSPDNDGFEDFTIINYTLSQPVSQIRMKVFDNRGRLVRTIVNNKASSSHGSVIFDGIGDDGRSLRMGIYIIFLEALNSNSGTVDNLKTVIVVAGRL